MMQQDKTFIAETLPPNLQKLIEDIRTAFKVPAANVGAKGDLDHRRGYHRSRRFLLSSQWSANRTYSVTEPGNDQGDDDWICAVDIKVPIAELISMCRRLDDAVRAGKLEKIAEWYGNRDGDTRVDGFDNIRNAVASSDPSHLWHAHLSFIRGRANEDHSDVLRILTGKEDDMDPDTQVPVPKSAPFPGYLGKREQIPAGELWHATYYHVSGIENALRELNTNIAKLTAAITKPGAGTSPPVAAAQVLDTASTATAILNDMAVRLKAAASAKSA